MKQPNGVLLQVEIGVGGAQGPAGTRKKLGTCSPPAAGAAYENFPRRALIEMSLPRLQLVT